MEGTKVVEKNLVRVLDNIKYEQFITSLSGALVEQDYSVLPVFDPAKNTLTFSDQSIKPIKKMVYTEIEMESLRNTRFSETMAAGAANTESSEFENLVINYAGAKLKVTIEKSFLAKVITILKGSADSIKVTNIPGDVKATLVDMYEACPDEVIADSETVMILDNSFRKAILAANLSADFRDIFVKNGENFFMYDMRIEFLDLGTGNGYIGRTSDVVLGTDLTSDFGALEVGKKFAYADILFIKGVYSLDAAVLNQSQKVVLV